jgi:phenylpropionate dioxygenase-like ring-hydroxylating dioxygenase large terminal subunit
VPNEDLAHLGTGPVSAVPYYDPAYFDLEREAIFKRTWLHLGRVSELPEPNGYIVRSIDVADASILIVRTTANDLRAFHNVCSHRGTQLVWAECGRARTFSCPYHMWNYANDGSLRSVPDESRFFRLDKAACGLRPVAIDTCGGFIFVNLDTSPSSSLREYLGPVAELLDALGLEEWSEFSEYRYNVAANWKTTYDNFQEVYHLRWAHKKSVGPIVVSAENPFGYPVRYNFMGRHRSMTLWYNRSAPLRPTEKVMYEVLASDDETTDAVAPPRPAEFVCIFPNLFLSTATNRYFTQEVWPSAVDRTTSTIRMYWRGKDERASMRFGREFSLASLVEVHTEDRELIEGAHRGLRTGVMEHVQYQAQEALCRHFINTVNEMVEEYRRLSAR